WLKGLLIRSPFRIPNDIRIWWSWLILWLLTALMAAGAILVADPDIGPFPAAVEAVASFLRWKANELGALFAFLGVVVLMIRGFRTRPARLIRLRLPILLLLASVIILVVAPLPVFTDPRFWGGLIA